MLRVITLTNFKRHASTRIEATPLTVFIGPNNSGKSSVFQAILSLQQASSRGLATFLSPGLVRQATSSEQPFLYPAMDRIDLGTFEDVVRTGQREIRLALEGDFTETDANFGGPRRVSFEIGMRENRLEHHSGTIEFEADALAIRGKIPWSWVEGMPRMPQSGPIALATAISISKRRTILDYSGIVASLCRVARLYQPPTRQLCRLLAIASDNRPSNSCIPFILSTPSEGLRNPGTL